MISFLLIGQSNMAGRGVPSEVEPIKNDRLFVLRNGRFLKMFVPVNPDRRTAGTNLAESFADAVSREYDTDVGLIPCADGGTRVEQWQPGEILYDNAVFQTKLALRGSTLAGVLWHQGESNSHSGKHENYEANCMNVFQSLRKDLALGEEIPFLVGGLGDFLAEYKEGVMKKEYPIVNAILEKIAREHDWIGFVPATGLTDKGDKLHFSAAALREFGHRYFEVFRKMDRLLKKGDSGPEAEKMSEMEQL